MDRILARTTLTKRQGSDLVNRNNIRRTSQMRFRRSNHFQCIVTNCQTPRTRVPVLQKATGSAFSQVHRSHHLDLPCCHPEEHAVRPGDLLSISAASATDSTSHSECKRPLRLLTRIPHLISPETWEHVLQIVFNSLEQLNEVSLPSHRTNSASRASGPL